MSLVIIILSIVVVAVVIALRLESRSSIQPNQAIRAPSNWIIFDVVGESFDNEDGSRRQDILEGYAEVGVIVELRFYRYKGEIAYGVFVTEGQIGNLSRNDAAEMFTRSDGASRVSGFIESVGISSASGLYGATIRIGF